MANYDLSGVLGLDASDFVSGVDDATDASQDLADGADETSESLFEFDSAGAAAGAALAGVGTAMQGVLDQTQGLRESLGRTSASLGMTAEETRGLATDLSNATFPVEDVTGTLDVLSQAGVKGEESLKETANAADLVADATGNTAESIAQNAIPALRAMGGDAEDLSENMDTFTFVARETMMSVDDFSRVVTKTGPELEELGLGVEETATIMAALEAKGLDSRTAMREFRQAARDAEGDQQVLIDTLGLSDEALAEQEQALEGARGATEAHASAANESLTAMDRARAAFEDLTLAAGGVLQPLSAAAPAMQTAGIAALTLSTINVSALIPSITGVVAAASPLLPILLPLAAAIGAVGVAVKNDWIEPMTIAGNVAEWVGGRFEWVRNNLDKVALALGPLGVAALALNKIWTKNIGGIQEITATVVDAVTDSINFLIEQVNRIEGVDIPTIASGGAPSEMGESGQNAASAVATAGAPAVDGSERQSADAIAGAGAVPEADLGSSAPSTPAGDAFDARSTSTGSRTATAGDSEELKRTIRQAVEGLRIETRLETDERGLQRWIEDIVDTRIAEAAGGGRP